MNLEIITHWLSRAKHKSPQNPFILCVQTMPRKAIFELFVDEDDKIGCKCGIMEFDKQQFVVDWTPSPKTIEAIKKEFGLYIKSIEKRLKTLQASEEQDIAEIHMDQHRQQAAEYYLELLKRLHPF